MKKQLRAIIQALFWQPLRGGNGVVMMYELSQYALNVLGIWMLVYEGLNEGQQYPENVLIATIAFLTAIAGLKQYLTSKKKEDNNGNGND